jgi:glycosyltransferase involved in cell wall biosynthesis
MTKHVVIVGPAHPYRGGIAQYNHRLAQELSAQGHTVEVYTFTLQYPNLLFPGKTQYSTSDTPKGVFIKRKINSINPFNWIKIGRELNNKKADLVIFRYWLPFMAPCLGTIARLIKKNKHTTCVAIADNIIPHEKRMGDSFLTRYFVNSVDRFLVMSKTVEEDLKTFSSSKPCAFYPHPLYDNFGELISKEAAKKTLQLEENTRYILFFGLIRDYKGLDLLLDAFSHPYFTEHNIKLLIAGEFYGSSEKYQAALKKLGTQGVLHDSFIPDEEVANYFCAADVVVQPYKSATQSGITQIAYHFNKPMIVTNVGGLAELIPHNQVGYCVKPYTSEIRQAIMRFYDENKEQAFSENAALEKNKFSWKGLVDSLLNIN